MTRIAIVGAGLTGRLLVLNLLRFAPAGSPVHICLLDRGDARYMGPAYSDDAGYLLLNVPAGRMGAFSADPEHFLKWVRARGHTAGPFEFLPRSLYRDYILELIEQALQARPATTTYRHLCGEAIDLTTADGHATIHLQDADPIVAEKVVLALGNFPPRHPPASAPGVLASPHYVGNPWQPGVLGTLSPHDTVLFVGTGQTSVDLLIALHQRAHKGPLIALSRRGLLPLAHRGFEPYPSFYDEIKETPTARALFHTIRHHLERAIAAGIDPRAVIDSLRPHTQTIWRDLPEAEKRRFLRHLFRYWEIIRSRIPPESETIVASMLASGQLRLAAGRVLDLVPAPGALQVHYLPRGTTAPAVIPAVLVLNCIGPESDIGRIDHPLMRNLLHRGLLRPGPARLGIDATPDGAVIAQDGTPSRHLYTAGPIMKGALWEILAVPELRVQAEQLAQHLLPTAPA